jgi:cobalt-zinc-cadmium efflux system outer membrane protein
MTWLAWLAGAASMVVAQSELSLAEAVQETLRIQPTLAALREQVSVAQGARRQAGLRPNPALVIQSENSRVPRSSTPFVFPQDSENFVFLQQTFLTAGKREKRVDVAGYALRRAELELALQRRLILARVRSAYWAAAGAQRSLELLEENLRTFRQIVDYHEVRVREGNMPENDLLRVRLEFDRFALAANQARLDWNRALIQLQREMGRPEFSTPRLTDPLEIPGEEVAVVDPETALANRQEVAIARTAIEEAHAQLALERANARPDVDVSLGYKRATGFDTAYAALQFDLPVLNRNQGNIEAATATIRVAEASLAATRALVLAEVRAAAADYDIRRRQVRDFLQRFREQANETSRIAQAAYRLGGADLLRLLDAERLRIEIELQNARSLAEYRQSIVQLENALGVSP